MNGGLLGPTYACLYATIFCSKRIEAQLQEIEQKSEKKKSEVRATSAQRPSAQRDINFAISWSRYRPSYSNARSRMGLVPPQHLPSRYSHPCE
jgi:hypothetical protein